MIVVFDINTIWRERPFAALAEQTDVMGVCPVDWLAALRNPSFRQQQGEMVICPVALPPGWASRTARPGQQILWRKVLKKSRSLNKDISTVIVTSPHYLPLLRLIPNNIKTIYYSSDDYRSYEGWNNMAGLEKQIVQRVNHSFFVSDALAERARLDYKVSPDRISVSMNATEERFSQNQDEILPIDPPCSPMPRPIAGVIGGISDRLDLDILHQCADSSKLGTLLLVGPLPQQRSKELEELLNHPRVISVGPQPHDTIHEWYKCLDVGLIPYRSTTLNAHCSPMRLFDHLASSAPIIATEACKQINQFDNHISVCSDIEAFGTKLQEYLTSDLSRPSTFTPDKLLWQDRATNILETIEKIKLC